MWAYVTESAVYCSILSSINCLSKSSKVNALEMKSSFWKCWTNQTVRVVPSRLSINSELKTFKNVHYFREAVFSKVYQYQTQHIFGEKHFEWSDPKCALKSNLPRISFCQTFCHYISFMMLSNWNSPHRKFLHYFSLYEITVCKCTMPWLLLSAYFRVEFYNFWTDDAILGVVW